MDLKKKLALVVGVILVVILSLIVVIILIKQSKSIVPYTINSVDQHIVSNSTDISYPAIRLEGGGVGSDQLVLAGENINRIIKDEVDVISSSTYPRRMGVFDSVRVKFEQIPVFIPAHNVFSIVLNVFLDGKKVAHPDNFIETFTFDIENGKRLSLADLFVKDSSYLERLSTLVIAELPRIARERDISKDTFFMEGVAPKVENFTIFTVSTDSITLIFNTYQIGPRPLGIVSVDIPFVKIADILDPKFIY
ncbi:MAG: RsiV family protein [Candidatus Paceibacterota bacterium]|jgi:hypothetical protein